MAKKHNETDLEYKHRVLDKLSPSFCGAKWYNATIWLGSGKTTSCHHPPAHFIDANEVKLNYKLLHNTPQKKEDRRKMQQGQRPPGCEYCWKIEDMGVDAISDRPYKSMTYSDEDLQLAKNTNYSEDFNLQTLEIAFDRTCQFACSYCNPGFSTTWVKDIKNNGPYKNLGTDGRNHFTHEHKEDQLFDYSETNPYIEAFFAWWEADLHKTLLELRITGGEPLMSGHTWKLIDWFRNNKDKSNTKLAINSNLGFERHVLERLISSVDVKQLTLYSSNEAIGKQAEYIRDGLDWDLWCSNMIYLLDSGVNKLNVMCTINALCLDSLTEFMDLMLEWKAKYGRSSLAFSLNIMRFPSFQGPLVLPDDLKQFYKEKIEAWYLSNQNNPLLHEFEKNHIRRLVEYLHNVKIPHGEGFERLTAEKDFLSFYSQYNIRRNKNIKVFSNKITDWIESINE